MFKGWIPTVAGRLSFSFVGRTNHPTLADFQNISDGKHRYVVCHQWRSLTDSILPPAVLRLVARLEGRFWCVCVAECSDDPSFTCNSEEEFEEHSALTGRLFMFREHSWWRPTAALAVEKMQRAFQGYEGAHVRPLKEYLELESIRPDEVARDLIQYCDMYCDFRLFRDGVAHLTPPENERINSHAPPVKPDVLQDVISELFFFLKDIVHEHQHHSPSTDSVTNVYEDNNDYVWRCKTLRALNRSALQFKRKRREELFLNSLGIIAYIKSFLIISRNKGHMLPVKMNLVPLERSIRAGHEVALSKSERRWRRRTIIVTGFLGAFALLIAIPPLFGMGTKRLEGAPHPLIEWLATQFYENTTLALFYSLPVALFSALLIAGAVVPDKLPKGRVILQIAAHTGDKVRLLGAALMSVGMAVLVALTYFVFF